MEWFKQLLAEKGELSMVRFLSLICVLTASVLAFIGIYSTTHSLESVALLCGTFLGAGLGAKVMQKKIEAVPQQSTDAISQIETSQSENESESVQNGDEK